MPKVHSKAKSKTKAVISRYRGKRPSLFGPPLLLVGEDAAEYDELHAAIRAAVNPVDTVDEMFVADVVALEWEVLRWRRLKSSLIRVYQIEALEKFLKRNEDSLQSVQKDFGPSSPVPLRPIFRKTKPNSWRTRVSDMSRSLMAGSIKSLTPASRALMTSWPQRSIIRRKNSRKSTDGANPTLSNLWMKFWPMRALALMSSWLRNWSKDWIPSSTLID